MWLQVGGGSQKPVASFWKFLPQPTPQLQHYSWNFHQPQDASSASRTVLVVPKGCSVFIVFISCESLGPQVSKGCLLDYPPAWRHWPAPRNVSGVRTTIFQLLGHIPIIHKPGLDQPHCMYKVKFQFSSFHPSQWCDTLIYFLSCAAPHPEIINYCNEL